MLAQAATGTGKTAAFALPMLHLVAPESPTRERTAALVLVPTRELAMQVAEAIHKYGKPLGVVAVPIYGGASMEGQGIRRSSGASTSSSRRRAGRSITSAGARSISSVKMVVLDEADEMLDMGFAEDLEAILAVTPRRTADGPVLGDACPRASPRSRRRHLHNPITIRIEREAVPAGTLAQVRQVAYIVARGNKTAALGRVLDVEAPTATIVFCRTRTEVDELTESLNAHGYRAEALHGGLNQEQRDRVMKKFRANKTDLLVATDVAARGLDVRHVSHVVNYDVPAAPEAYVHRIGRTGRAGRAGVAITLANPREHQLAQAIETVTRQPIPVKKLPTVADLRARRLELTRAALRESLLEDDLETFRAVVESLSEEFDLFDVALAAVKLAHEASGTAGGEEELPEAGLPPADDRRGRRKASERDQRRGRPAIAGTTRLFVGTGRASGVRPQDLVGAITGESYLSGTDIGAIEIADRFSLVEVPESAADDVAAALRQTSIKGRRATVRRDADRARWSGAGSRAGARSPRRALRAASSARARRSLVAPRPRDIRGGSGHLGLGEGEVAAAPHAHGVGLDERELEGWLDEGLRGHVGAVVVECRVRTWSPRDRR